MNVRGLFQCDMRSFHFVDEYLSAIECCQYYNTLYFDPFNEWYAAAASELRQYTKGYSYSPIEHKYVMLQACWCLLIAS